MNKNISSIVRRSVALPKILVEEAKHSAPPELQTNFNQLVIVSLRTWIETRKRDALENQIAAMARDPEVQKEISCTAKELEITELDGLA